MKLWPLTQKINSRGKSKNPIKDLLKFQKETGRQINKLAIEAAKDRKKTDLQINKLATETAKAFARANEALEKNVKDTEKWRKKARDFVTGEVGNRWGDLVEVITKENLGRLLKERGFKIHRVYGNVADEDKRRWQIDVMAVNGKEIVIVEAKASLTVKDVKLFIKKKLPKIREYLPEHKDKKNPWCCFLP